MGKRGRPGWWLLRTACRGRGAIACGCAHRLHGKGLHCSGRWPPLGGRCCVPCAAAAGSPCAPPCSPAAAVWLTKAPRPPHPRRTPPRPPAAPAAPPTAPAAAPHSPRPLSLQSPPPRPRRPRRSAPRRAPRPRPGPPRGRKPSRLGARRRRRGRSQTPGSQRTFRAGGGPGFGWRGLWFWLPGFPGSSAAPCGPLARVGHSLMSLCGFGGAAAARPGGVACARARRAAPLRRFARFTGLRFVQARCAPHGAMPGYGANPRRGEAGGVRRARSRPSLERAKSEPPTAHLCFMRHVKPRMPGVANCVMPTSASDAMAGGDRQEAAPSCGLAAATAFLPPGTMLGCQQGNGSDFGRYRPTATAAGDAWRSARHALTRVITKSTKGVATSTLCALRRLHTGPVRSDCPVAPTAVRKTTRRLPCPPAQVQVTGYTRCRENSHSRTIQAQCSSKVLASGSRKPGLPIHVQAGERAGGWRQMQQRRTRSSGEYRFRSSNRAGPQRQRQGRRSSSSGRAATRRH